MIKKRYITNIDTIDPDNYSSASQSLNTINSLFENINNITIITECLDIYNSIIEKWEELEKYLKALIKLNHNKWDPGTLQSIDTDSGMINYQKEVYNIRLEIKDAITDLLYIYNVSKDRQFYLENEILFKINKRDEMYDIFNFSQKKVKGIKCMFLNAFSEPIRKKLFTFDVEIFPLDFNTIKHKKSCYIDIQQVIFEDDNIWNAPLNLKSI